MKMMLYIVTSAAKRLKTKSEKDHELLKIPLQ